MFYWNFYFKKLIFILSFLIQVMHVATYITAIFYSLFFEWFYSDMKCFNWHLISFPGLCLPSK
jgi:hypothetical protein